MEDDAMRVARPVQLSSEQRKSLEQQSRARSQSARVVERARIVLRAADELEDKEIAAEFGITPEKAARWRNRFLDGGLAALQKDAPRPGRSRTITEARVKQVVDMTTRQKPNNATHWSTRTMAAAAGVSAASVRRIWHAHGLKPHLVRTFKVSNDPHFADKLETIVGLYLNPPEHAIVLCADEKSQIQALDRTQPGLPLKKGRCGTMTHDYKRNGTATLFAALDTLDGSVISMCDDRHRHQEWLRFLRVIDMVTPPNKQIHMIVDNPQTHQGTEVAGAPSPFPCLLHAHQLFLAQHGRALLPRSHRKPSAPRRLSRRRGTHHGHRRVHRQTQPKPQAFHLDGQGHRYPGEGQTLPLVTG
jgi:transposase